jgi:hypothetical protein
MVFAFVQVDGHAARVPGTGENSSARRLERRQRKEKPPNLAEFSGLAVEIFSKFF